MFTALALAAPVPKTTAGVPERRVDKRNTPL